MLSRVAETIYWMQRYRERAENTARLLDVNLNLTLDLPTEKEKQWEPLLRATGHFSFFEKLYGEATEESVTEYLSFDERNPNSIISCLSAARENARTVRETITSEMWHEINTMYLYVRQCSTTRSIMHSPHQFYNRIKRQCQLFTGIADTTLSHNEAWHFGRVGYLLERADMTSRIIDVKYFILLPSAEYVGSPYDNIQWSALLKSVSALEMYRKRWRQIQHTHVVDFLMLDREFPRAILSCLGRAEYSLHAISGKPREEFANDAQKKLWNLRIELGKTAAEDIFKKGLHEYLDNFQKKLIEINESIYETFFKIQTPENIAKQTQESTS